MVDKEELFIILFPWYKETSLCWAQDVELLYIGLGPRKIVGDIFVPVIQWKKAEELLDLVESVCPFSSQVLFSCLTYSK